MSIGIIGGGITGLATAIGLKKLGLPFHVYEQAPQLSEVGAGIWMQPNAMQVLQWLGIADEIKAQGMELNRVELTNHELKPIAKVSNAIVSDEFGNRNVAIHRARLQQILLNAISPDEISLGHQLVNVQESGDHIELEFANRQTQHQVVLGADGIHSNVRKHLFPKSGLRYSGQTCWRGIANMELAEEYRQLGREAWGKHIRFGFSQISTNEVYWFAVATAPQNGKDNPATFKLDLLDMYSAFHPLVTSIIEQTDEDKIIRSDISDLKRLATWHQGNSCLLGDAAHATTPNMGQGGCQGMEDAYFISQLLAKHEDAPTAFAAFEKLRREKVDYIVNTSWRFGQLAHSTIGQPIARSLMKLTPPSVMEKQMKKVFALSEV
jgi:2-polyprenyl-6-methoxyphenol hydroxylase-like FAD-dependent oxidoreductase